VIIKIKILTFSADGTVTTTFKETPAMASYLLAFIVSDLKHISNEKTKLPDETLHRIWVRPDSLSKAAYALENSEKVLKALEDYIGIDFEFRKIDSVGVPNKGGAMENWGMVTYR
jgi:aminopeptidase N